MREKEREGKKDCEHEGRGKGGKERGRGEGGKRGEREFDMIERY